MLFCFPVKSKEGNEEDIPNSAVDLQVKEKVRGVPTLLSWPNEVIFPRKSKFLGKLIAYTDVTTHITHNPNEIYKIIK